MNLDLSFDHGIRELTSPIAFTAYVRRAAATLGLSAQSVYARYGIGDDDWQSDGRTSHIIAREVWQELERQSDDPLLGLRMAAGVDCQTISLLHYTCLSSATLHEAVGIFFEFQSVLSNALEFGLSAMSGGCVLLSFGSILGAGEMSQKRSQFWLLSLVKLFSHVIGQPLRPTKIYLTHEPLASLEAYQEFFDCPIEFGHASAGIIISAEDLAKPSVHCNAALHRVHLQQLQEHIAEADMFGIEAIRSSLIRGGDLGTDLASLASRMCVSKRTLQRILARHNTSYSELVDLCRRDFALSTLRDTRRPIKQISYSLGYKSVATLHKAMRRWIGQTPQQYRNADSYAAASYEMAPAE